MTTPWTEAFPRAWKRVRLRNLIDHVQNGVWGEEPGNGDGVVCIRAADFDREHQRLDESRLVRRSFPPADLKKHLLRQGDLVLEKSGGGERQPVGTAILFDKPYPAVATNFAARVRPSHLADSRFLAYVLSATYTLGINHRSIKQTTGIQNLDTQALFSEPWAVPTVDQQRTIADFLDRETSRIERLISEKRRLAELVEERLRASIARMTALPSAPLANLGRFLETIDQGHSPVCDADRADAGWGVLKLSAVHGGRFKPHENKAMRPGEPVLEEFRLGEGDVLVTRANTPDLVGDVCLVRDDPGQVLLPDLIYRLRLRPGLDPRFLVYVLLSAARRRLIESVARGSSQSMVKLRAEDLRMLPIPVVSEDEQRRIADDLDSATSWAERLGGVIEQQLFSLQEHRQVLISSAVTGRLQGTGTLA